MSQLMAFLKKISFNDYVIKSITLDQFKNTLLEIPPIEIQLLIIDAIADCRIFKRRETHHNHKMQGLMCHQKCFYCNHDAIDYCVEDHPLCTKCIINNDVWQECLCCGIMIESTVDALIHHKQIYSESNKYNDDENIIKLVGKNFCRLCYGAYLENACLICQHYNDSLKIIKHQTGYGVRICYVCDVCHNNL